METYVKDQKIVFAMVGLPARGKSYIAHKIVCYLKWLGTNAEFFNIGNYRRNLYGTKECTAEFFDHNNAQGNEARKEAAIAALKDLVSFLKDGGQIAVYDGTNTTVDRRRMIKHYLDQELGTYSLVWIESICTDEKIIENNIRSTKLKSSDYKEVDAEIAIRDFKTRIQRYSEVYQELSAEPEFDGEDAAFIKLYNVSTKIVIHRIYGYIESKLVSFLMNLHITDRPIYIFRHGESTFNVEGRVGGDPDLSDRGREFLPKIADFFEGEKEKGRVGPKTKIFTSTLRRAIYTAEAIKIGPEPMSLKALDELDVGICDSMIYDEIAEQYPKEWEARTKDKLRYRYPMGESYIDLIHRVEPVIFAMERCKDPVIVVAHQAVLRCIYGYFTRQNIQEIPYLEIPLGTVLRVNPNAYDSHIVKDNLDKIVGKTSL